MVAKNISDSQLEELKQLCGAEVDVQLRQGGEEGLTHNTLRRWLVARKGDVKEAAKALRAHAAWRAGYVPNGRISAEEIEDELKQNKAFLPGFDKSGRPFCIVIVSRHQMKDADMSKRYIAYSLDCASLLGSTRPGWDGKMSGIFDLRGLKAANCDLATLRNVFDLLQNHYPERLHTLWLFNAPVIFYGIYKLVYPFIDPVTREKVRFVYEKGAETEFLAAFDLDVLPPEICPRGTGSWITVQQRYDMLLQEAATARASGGAASVAEVNGTPNGAATAAAVVGDFGLGEQQRHQPDQQQPQVVKEQPQEAHVEVGTRPIEVVA